MGGHNMEYADLHLHSTASDGTCPVSYTHLKITQLVQKECEDFGLELIDIKLEFGRIAVSYTHLGLLYRG